MLRSENCLLTKIVILPPSGPDLEHWGSPPARPLIKGKLGSSRKPSGCGRTGHSLASDG